MKELSELGNSMLGWFSDFWTWLADTKIGDLTGITGDGITEWLPDWLFDSILNLPLITVFLGGVMTFYVSWVLVSWVIDILP